MKSATVIALAAFAVLQLGACHRASDRAANKPDTTPTAVGADKQKSPAEEPFNSSVTPGSVQAADAELSKKVKTALSTATDISAGGLEVASSDGVVTLYGTVDAPAERDRAAMLAMEIDGVRSVVNNLVVVKGS